MRKRDDDAAPPAIVPSAERARQPDDNRLRGGCSIGREAHGVETDAPESHLHQPPARGPLLRFTGPGIDDGTAQPQQLADHPYL